MKPDDVLETAGYAQLDFSKNLKQRKFLLDPRPYLLYSGGFGSGKTTVCNLKGVIISGLMPNNLGVVCRETYPALRETTRENFFSVCPSDWIKNWKESENALQLKNNSTILFRHFENNKIKVGANLGWFFVDQAEEATKEIFMALQGRLRRKEVPRHYGMLAMNPNGKDWQYKMFVEGDSDDYGSYQSSSYDNKDNLPQDYIKNMRANYPADWVARFIDGTWNTMSGLIFHEFNHDRHMVDPFPIPKNWIKGRGLDWGVDAPATCVHVAISPEGMRYVFAEYGDREKTPEEHARAILRQSTLFNPYRASVMDDSAFNRGNDLKSVADKYGAKGLILQRATRDVSASILHLKQLFKTDKIKLFRGMTPQLIGELESWKWGSPKLGKEIPARGNDHWLDALRYILYWFDRKIFATGDLGLDSLTNKYRRDTGARLNVSQPKEACDPVTGLPG